MYSSPCPFSTEALQRIPDEERDSPDDIIRWLQEVQGETKRGVCKLIDFFVVAHIGEAVAGFAYAHFYPAFSLAFFSYLVVDDKIRDAAERGVSRELIGEIANQLSRLKCKGVVAEVDKSQVEALVKHFRPLSRQRLFPLKKVSISYWQPPLSVDDKLQEHPLQLVYAVPSRDLHVITKDEMISILRFISEAVYGDQFEPPAYPVYIDQKYKSVLNSWCENLVRKLPNGVNLD